MGKKSCQIIVTEQFFQLISETRGASAMKYLNKFENP